MARAEGSRCNLVAIRDLVTYVLVQCLGAISGAMVLWLILRGKASGWNGGLGANGWGLGYLGEYNLVSASVFEVVATFRFLVTILGVPQSAAANRLAGLAIGLTLAAIHIVGISTSGVSVNPARSLGPALLVGGNALGRRWRFIVAPLAGAAATGWMFRAELLSAQG